MEKMSITNYLDVSDNESSERALSKKKRIRSKSKSKSYSSSYKKRESKNRKKYEKNSSKKYKSDRRKNYSSSNSERSRSRNKKNRKRKYSSSSQSSSESSSSSSNIKEYEKKAPKWSMVESDTTKQGKKIVTVGKKEKETRSQKIEDIKPNENIKLEEKEKPNFEPSGLLAKQTNTKK